MNIPQLGDVLEVSIRQLCAHSVLDFLNNQPLDKIKS